MNGAAPTYRSHDAVAPPLVIGICAPKINVGRAPDFLCVMVTRLELAQRLPLSDCKNKVSLYMP